MPGLALTSLSKTISDFTALISEQTMGKILKAACQCGYETSVMVGSGREQHGIVFEFPHCCLDCNETVSVDILSRKSVCPSCGGTSLKVYGTQKPSTPPKKSWFQTMFEKNSSPEVPQVVSADCYNIEMTFEIADQGHYCPKCKKQTLLFTLEWLVD